MATRDDAEYAMQLIRLSSCSTGAHEPHFYTNASELLLHALFTPAFSIGSTPLTHAAIKPVSRVLAWQQLLC
jgi:hypothetical protein